MHFVDKKIQVKLVFSAQNIYDISRQNYNFSGKFDDIFVVTNRYFT